MASPIVIKLNDVDITSKVLFASAKFQTQLAAIPGTAEFTVKDPDQTFSAVTGDEVTLDVDGIRLWGGFVSYVTHAFAFPAVDTTTPENVTARQFRLQCVDYNILFDKRVLRNTSNYLTQLSNYALDKTMGELIKDPLCASYLDLDGLGLDTTTYVENLYVPRFDADGNPDPSGTAAGAWPQQGSKWREVMEDFSQFGAVYYIDAEKNLHFHAAETTDAAWGFSDVPNKWAIGTPGATYGMREFEQIDDASAMVNDAFVWGGSEWAGSAGGTVFKRATNTDSVTSHGRWQYAEVKFGDLKDQGLVTARANVIVSGNTTGAVGGDTSRGLAVEQRQVRLAWFAKDVPKSGGIPVHLKPSDVVTMEMYVLTPDNVNPLTIVLPLRELNITFPGLDDNGDAHVRFDGYFGVQLSDPYWLWKHLRDTMAGIKAPTIIATADDNTTTATYGAFGSFSPTPTPDNGTTVFSIPFAYIAGTTTLYKGSTGGGGYLLTPGTHYTESDPAAGEVTMTTAPTSSEWLWLTCRIAGGI